MQDVTNRPATVDVTSSPSKAREVLTLGAAAAAIKRELGFAELGMRDTVFAAWQEIDWTETEARRAMSLKEHIAELCSELSIWTGWEVAAMPPQKLSENKSGESDQSLGELLSTVESKLGKS